MTCIATKLKPHKENQNIKNIIWTQTNSRTNLIFVTEQNDHNHNGTALVPPLEGVMSTQNSNQHKAFSFVLIYEHEMSNANRN